MIRVLLETGNWLSIFSHPASFGKVDRDVAGSRRLPRVGTEVEIPGPVLRTGQHEGDTKVDTQPDNGGKRLPFN